MKSVNSTNLWAKNNQTSLDPNIITCITAEEQTAGYGREKRKWISISKKDLSLTFYFTLKKDTLHLQSLSHILSLSLCNVLKKEKLNPADQMAERHFFIRQKN